MSHRPNILKLATKISLESLTYTGISYKDPEYRILDPIVDDDATQALRAQVAQAAQAVDSRITIHDFRMVPGPSHTNLIFDAVVPYDEALPHGEVARRIREAVKALPGGPYHAVVTVETSYV